MRILVKYLPKFMFKAWSKIGMKQCSKNMSESLAYKMVKSLGTIIDPTFLFKNWSKILVQQLDQNCG